MESRRARRRRLTATVASRRRSDYHRQMFIGLWWPSGNWNEWASKTSANYWAKKSTGSCTCRKRHKGAPRRDKGMCDLGARTRIYRLRATARELNRLLVLRGADPDDDSVAVLTCRLVNDLWRLT